MSQFLYNFTDTNMKHEVAFPAAAVSINRDYYIGSSLSPDLSARDSNIGPRACPRSDIGRGLIDRVMTKTPCYDLFII